MPERSLPSRLRAACFAAATRLRLRHGLALVFLPALVLLAGACTEEFEGGGACPALCPQQQAPFRDTVIEAIAFDTTLGPFPVLGASSAALVAARGDTLTTYVVVRFDALPSTYSPNNQPINEAITSVDSSVLRFVVDTSGLKANGDFTLEVFNVDTTQSDSVSAVVRSLFRPDRKVGEVVVPASLGSDTLRVPISDAFVAERIVAQQRIRLGLRIVPTRNAQIRLGAFVNGVGAPRLTFDPAGDTLYRPLDVTPQTTLPGAESDEILRLAYTVYTLPVQGPPGLPPGTLGAGGIPGRRPYFRFAIPRSIIDSSTVVRAQLLLTQRPAPGPDRGDSVGIQPFIGVSRSTVSDIYLATVLSANGLLAGVDSLRLVPRDSGERAINLVNVVRGWAAQDTSITRFIALRLNGEGFNGSEIRFFDRSAPPALRPRLRITYLPRTEFALP